MDAFVTRLKQSGLHVNSDQGQHGASLDRPQDLSRSTHAGASDARPSVGDNGDVYTETPVREGDAAAHHKHYPALTKELATSRAKANTVFLTWTNYHFIDFVQNWSSHLRDIGMTHTCDHRATNAMAAAIMPPSMYLLMCTRRLCLGEWISAVVLKGRHANGVCLQRIRGWDDEQIEVVSIKTKGASIGSHAHAAKASVFTACAGVVVHVIAAGCLPFAGLHDPPESSTVKQECYNTRLAASFERNWFATLTPPCMNSMKAQVHCRAFGEPVVSASTRYMHKIHTSRMLM